MRRVPPVGWFALAAAVQRVVPGRPAAAAVSLAAVLPLAFAAWLGAGSLAEFVRASTTVHPTHPERATTLVTGGPNALTRNPMYMALASLLVAHAAHRRSAMALLPVAGFVLVIDAGQIPPEEQALTALFGAEYTEYASRVPRWLGIPRT